ncbi:hypothetical protein [Deinococcus cellulosilyticus]|uniref:hypothetical protein n=1 Tax=Deinococcus cellulosilyticus TaxID=401558 RepID=UPI0016498091|nr:hypothetical protein [Deinococcus cellulosilyticus]
MKKIMKKSLVLLVMLAVSVPSESHANTSCSKPGGQNVGISTVVITTNGCR